MFYAICDCDNCYANCERLFRPDLRDKPVVVLSNNDGCVVARSNEAKQMGIRSGMPYYQMKEQFPNAGITVFSSNYELYGELTARVMNIIKDASPQMFRYSIDECFCVLPDMTCDDLRLWGEALHQKILRYTGLPVSIGIARTKTLAKAASHFAKRYSGYHHCCIIDTEEKRTKALQLFPLEKVWGIGRRNAPKLMAMGDKTAFDFTRHTQQWVRLMLHVTGLRTWRELRGDDCIPNEEPASRKSICTSRSFAGTTADYEEVRTHVANFAVHCARKLRMQHSVGTIVSVFIHTNRFKEDQQQYWNCKETTLLTPSNATQQIVQAATRSLQAIFVPGLQYKKAGVIVMGIIPNNVIQTNFIDYNREKMEKQIRLDQVIDQLNKRNRADTVVLGAQQYRQKDGHGKPVTFADAMQHAFKSKNPTTRWSDIIILK